MLRPGIPNPDSPPDPSASDPGPVTDTVIGIALFALVVLINGILAALLLEALQVFGWLETVALEASGVPSPSGARSARLGDTVS